MAKPMYAEHAKQLLLKACPDPCEIISNKLVLRERLVSCHAAQSRFLDISG